MTRLLLIRSRQLASCNVDHACRGMGTYIRDRTMLVSEDRHQRKAPLVPQFG